MADELYLTGDVQQATGIPFKTLNEWSVQGVLSYAQNGRGPGCMRMWSTVDAVAAMMGYLWRQHGAGMALVQQVVNCVASLTEEELETELARDKRVIIGGQLIRVSDPEQLPEDMDVAKVYAKVKAGLKQVQERRRRDRRGRGAHGKVG
jgi:hypothetical protein